ncbi:copper homeostasis protein CutC [Aquimarina sediminis]|uniref:copper homeostasis protein CutC n=1 Tax=Aquimarina sediminis TaxID=2070536 RepID=UPI000CA04BA3|nr:copper homeostasis protein CutC [Aquimarina sediminis]
MKKKLEICCYSTESAIHAEKYGADRVELCDNYLEGGTTPSYATIQHSIEKLMIPVNVIVRPRGGDFLYTKTEYEIIKKDVLEIKKLNANGIVIGFLKANGEVDIQRTKTIVDIAKPMEVTFHRAIDMCKNPLSALKQLKEIGVTRVLTSGAKKTALEGTDLISELVQQADGKIIIMPGSGVTEKNLKELIQKTKATEFHSSAKTFEKSKMKYYNTNINMGGNNTTNEFKKIIVDTESIKKMVAILNDN